MQKYIDLSPIHPSHSLSSAQVVSRRMLAHVLHNAKPSKHPQGLITFRHLKFTQCVCSLCKSLNTYRDIWGMVQPMLSSHKCMDWLIGMKGTKRKSDWAGKICYLENLTLIMSVSFLNCSEEAACKSPIHPNNFSHVGKGLCIFTITFILPSLCTFWHAIPTSLFMYFFVNILSYVVK